MNVYLIGFMGVGKTTYGKKLAHKLNFKFIDLDKYIEDKYKFTIPSFFSVLGEEAFRTIENLCLKEISCFENIIVSTGGGTPCFYDNLNVIKSSGLSIYLKMNPLQLISRLSNSKKKRPLLKNRTSEELQNFISETLTNREKYYLQADYIVDALNLKTTELVQIIQKHLSI